MRMLSLSNSLQGPPTGPEASRMDAHAHLEHRGLKAQ